MGSKQEFMAHLQKSFRDYYSIIDQHPLERAQAKSYINGLMVAGKIFGITYEELQQVLSEEQKCSVVHSTKVNFKDTSLFDIPTYIRNKIKLSE